MISVVLLLSILSHVQGESEKIVLFLKTIFFAAGVVKKQLHLQFPTEEELRRDDQLGKQFFFTNLIEISQTITLGFLIGNGGSVAQWLALLPAGLWALSTIPGSACPFFGVSLEEFSPEHFGFSS